MLIIKTIVALIATTIFSIFVKGFYFEFFYLSLLSLELLSVGINFGKKTGFYYLLYTGLYAITGGILYLTQLPMLAIALLVMISIKRNHYITRTIKALKAKKEKHFNKNLKSYLRNKALENKRTANAIYNVHFNNFFDYEQNKRNLYVYKE